MQPALRTESALHHASVIAHRVLFAISAQERADFFPGGSPEFADTEIRWCPNGPLTPDGWFALLDEFRPTVIISCWSTPPISPAFLGENSSLRYVCHLVGSARHLVPRSFLERGGLLTNWGSIASDTVAEHALLLALATLRNQSRWSSAIATRPVPWRNATARLDTRTLIGRRIGIHGFGLVARNLVRILRPFGTDIAAFSHGVPDSIMTEAGVTPSKSLADLAARSEVFFCCEALNTFTRGSIDADIIAALPDHAVFINVGRGALVDEPALLAEATSGRIHIALDVVSHEPLLPDSPASQVRGAILSPHIAGPTYDRFPECGHLALSNLSRFIRGEPLSALLTPELYDRST
ncbi:MAG TPA: hydroxyacid dehydrogenase [Rariglobus sp.]